MYILLYTTYQTCTYYYIQHIRHVHIIIYNISDMYILLYTTYQTCTYYYIQKSLRALNLIVIKFKVCTVNTVLCTVYSVY